MAKFKQSTLKQVLLCSDIEQLQDITNSVLDKKKQQKNIHTHKKKEKEK
ncbi:MAG: hypothetical protein N0E48_14840 [Candidatus Thiodiazotropha endolucinida]|nr:hypothetical protein [Candidatus Thiodiazotropha taylori]MCW4344612.1 hypothetical protein [Candidatus Thiodiazotropha endolucinida]